jgi:cathepsin L
MRISSLLTVLQFIPGVLSANIRGSYDLKINAGLSNNGFHYGLEKSVHKYHEPKNEMSWYTYLLHNADKVENDILPKSVDWREKGVVSPVKDQGRCGSCWAFASTATIESHVALNSSKLFDLSPQQIAACTPNPEKCGGAGNCNGATAELAFDYVASSKGLLQEFQYSYSSYQGVESDCLIPNSPSPKASIDGYVRLPINDYNALLFAVANIGPIAVSVDASSWSKYTGGIFNDCDQVNPDINHAVVLVGYGEEEGKKYWIIRNSWSPSWGENGYIRLARFDDDEERCGLDITPLDGSACEGETEPVTACGTCGVLFDSSFPIGARAL